MKSWVKGGLIGAGILSILPIIQWIRGSITHHCILVPIQSINFGGPNCGWRGNLLASLVYIFVIFFIGFFFGAGWFIGKKKTK